MPLTLLGPNRCPSHCDLGYVRKRSQEATMLVRKGILERPRLKDRVRRLRVPSMEMRTQLIGGRQHGGTRSLLGNQEG